MHQENPRWGSDGHKHLFDIAHIIETLGIKTVLDYGCGKGVFKRDILKLYPKLRVSEYDPGIPGKNIAPLPAFDLIVCTDVLEHVEPGCIDSVVAHIRSLTAKAAYFVISTRPAKATLPDGRNAHLIIENYLWWGEKLDQHFEMCISSRSHKEMSYFGVIR